MKFIEIGRHKIEVQISPTGKRMIKLSDAKELLDLTEDKASDCFVDAGMLTDILFKKI